MGQARVALPRNDKGVIHIPELKQRPKTGKTKGKKSKSAAMPRQAARMMKEKYIKELKQRPRGAEGDSQTAPDQVENAGRWAADELAGRAVEQGRALAKRKFAAGRGGAQAAPDPTSPEETPPAPDIPGDRPAAGRSFAAPRERQTAERPPTAPKQRPQAERTANPIKDRRMVEGRAAQGQSGTYRAAQPRRTGQNRPIGAVRPLRERPMAQGFRERPMADTPRPNAGGHTAPVSPRRSDAVPPRARGQRALKERPRLKFHSRGRYIAPSPGAGGKASPPAKAAPALKTRRGLFKSAIRASVRPAGPAGRAAKTAQKQMRRQMLTQAVKPVKNIAAAFRRAVQAVAKAAAAVTGAVSAVVGGCVLLVALVIVIVIAAVANSPFGLFFAQEPNAPEAVSVSQAVGSVNMAYNAKLELLQAGGYSSIDIQGAAPDWPDVLAVFAVKVAGADVDGMDVATMDADRVAKLTAVFWDMTAIATRVETIDHPATDDTEAWTEKILHITITPKGVDDMRAAYAFTAYQNSALDELLADRAALASLAGSLSITSADVLEVLRALPDDLSPERRAVVEKVLSLVGKVNYFWGGKSYVIGWDSRWGTLQKVTSPGSSTSGTYRPYGLDCSGFLDWALRNAGLHSDGHWYIGRNLTAVSQADAMPGDFALYPDASHVGMVVGRNSAGKLLVCHCSYGMNNVVVTEFSASGFTAVGRQPLVPR